MSAVRLRNLVAAATLAVAGQCVPVTAHPHVLAFFLVPFPVPPSVIVLRPPSPGWVPEPSVTVPFLRPPPPAGRCYAGAVVCPLARADLVGSPCECETKQGKIAGRGLIPPAVSPGQTIVR